MAWFIFIHFARPLSTAIILVKHDLPLVNPCCLFSVTFFSIIRPKMTSKRIFSVIFWGTELRLSGLHFSGASFWPFVEDGYNIWISSVTGVLSQSSQSELESGLARTLPVLSASSGAAHQVPWTWLGQVLSDNPWLSPYTLLLLLETILQAQRPGRLKQWRLRLRRPYLCLLSPKYLPHSAKDSHFPCSALMVLSRNLPLSYDIKIWIHLAK